MHLRWRRSSSTLGCLAHKHEPTHAVPAHASTGGRTFARPVIMLINARARAKHAKCKLLQKQCARACFSVLVVHEGTLFFEHCQAACPSRHRKTHGHASGGRDIIS
eukprot:1160412-Pelagomonas_calceolata.AAC.8